MQWIFLFLFFMITGLFGAIGVSMRAEAAFGPSGGMLAGILCLCGMWTAGFACLREAFKI